MRKYLILCLILVFVGFIFQLPGIRNKTAPVFLFPSKVIHNTINGIGNFFTFLFQAKDLDKENKLLKEQLEEIETQNSLYRAKIAELERLKKYEKEQAKFLISNVIARDPSNWFKTVSIDKGEDSGVKINMVALLPEGVVGRIIEVAPEYSTVLLAVDHGSEISAIIRETRELGIVEGRGDFIIMNFFSRDIQAKPGDIVMTSGLGGIFPKGLTLGEITQVRRVGLVAEAEVKPAVDFNKLEEVLVLIR